MGALEQTGDDPSVQSRYDWDSNNPTHPGHKVLDVAEMIMARKDVAEGKLSRAKYRKLKRERIREERLGIHDREINEELRDSLPSGISVIKLDSDTASSQSEPDTDPTPDSDSGTSSSSDSSGLVTGSSSSSSRSGPSASSGPSGSTSSTPTSTTTSGDSGSLDLDALTSDYRLIVAGLALLWVVIRG